MLTATDSAAPDVIAGHRPHAATPRRPGKRVGLLTPYTGENLGDAAIQEAAIAMLRATDPARHIVGFSMDPRRTARSHSIPFFHYCAWFGHMPRASTPASSVGRIRAFFRRVRNAVARRIDSVWWYREIAHFWQSFRLAKDVDTFVVSGGGQIDDYWGGWRGHPLTLLKWALIARLRGKAFVVLSVGRGEVASFQSRLCYNVVLRLAHYRSYRDVQSKRLLLCDYSFVAGDPVTPDLAYSLPASRRPSARNGRSGRLGVSPMAFMDPRAWPEKDQSLYARYIETLADAVVSLLDDYPAISLFPSVLVHDTRAIDDLRNALRSRLGDSTVERRISAPRVNGVDDLLKALAQCDVFVASRLHGVILSHWMIVPTVAVSYDKKVNAAMEALGQSEYCTELLTLTPSTLVELVRRADRHHDAIRRSVADRIDVFASQLDAQARALQSQNLI